LQPTTAGRSGEALVRWFDDHQPRAFCAGLLRPRIYLSRQAARSLSAEQLTAVIAHEQHHVRRRDPLRLLVARAAGDAFFFLPLLKRLAERYAELAELAADEAAVRIGGTPQPLASALLAFEAQPGSPLVGIAPERVDHLLGQPPRWHVPMALLLGTLVVLAAVLALGLHAAEAGAHGSLNLPLLSAQLCMVAMAVLPPALGAGAVLWWRSRSRA
ncbi:MAG: M56 family metallopeptidase, partial [Actinomycetota bacterium]|nr:M56 family metallopeptidase [Actinomycetota bacterium]